MRLVLAYWRDVGALGSVRRLRQTVHRDRFRVNRQRSCTFWGRKFIQGFEPAGFGKAGANSVGRGAFRVRPGSRQFFV